MESRFWKLYRQFITEQQDAAVPQAVANIEGGMDLQSDQSALQADQPPQQTDITNQDPTANLDNAGFVTLIRLLKDAFVLHPKDEDADVILNIGNINSANAYEKFNTILGLIKKYNPEIDVDLSLGKIQK